MRLCPIPNDRPHDVHPIFPVTLLHPIFAEFKHDITNLSAFDPESQDVQLALEFVVKSLEIYPEEGERIEATSSF